MWGALDPVNENGFSHLRRDREIFPYLSSKSVPLETQLVFPMQSCLHRFEFRGAMITNPLRSGNAKCIGLIAALWLALGCKSMYLKKAVYTRRAWLQLTSAALAAAMADRALAGEGKGSWDDKNIAEYSQKLIDWLQANFAQRASTLITLIGMDVKLDYDYLGPTEDKSRKRQFEKFAEGKLAQKAGQAHLAACLTELERIRQSLAATEAKAMGL